MRIFRNFPGDEKLYENLKRVLCKSDIKAEWEVYRSKRQKMIILGIGAMVLVLLASVLIGMWKFPLTSQSIARPDYGQDDNSYDFYAENEQGEKESVHMEVSARAYTKEEAEQRFESYYQALKGKISGSNSSLALVTQNLDFSEIEGYEDVTLDIYTSDPELIDGAGNVLRDGLSAGEYDFTLYIQMSCGQYQKNYDMEGTVYVDSSRLSVNSYLNELEDSADTNKEISLPEDYNGQSYIYYTRISWGSLAGMVLSVFSLIIYGIYAQESKIKESCRKKEKELEAEYPMLLSRLMILTRAGMSVKKAWYKIISDHESNTKDINSYLIREMIITKQDIERGVNEKDAYLEFGRRCGIPCYIKLGSLLEQNLRKGTKGMLGLLESERIMALERRKQQVRTSGETAGGKLMMPMMVLFILVLVIVMVPAMMSFNM